MTSNINPSVFPDYRAVRKRDLRQQFAYAKEEIEELQERTDGIKNITEFGAKGDGLSDDTIYLQAAFDSGSRLSGGGRTYKITQQMAFPDNLDLSDITIKTGFPPGASTQLFTGTSLTRTYIRRMRIIRWGDGTLGTQSNRDLYFLNCSNIRIEDFEASGDGGGVPISVEGCDNVWIDRPYIHDINWERSINPGGELIAGITVIFGSNVTVVNPRILHLTGTVNGVKQLGPGNADPSLNTYAQTDGITVGGTRNFSLIGGVIQDVGEGTDITSQTNPNYGIKIIGTIYYQCVSYGVKIVHGARSVIIDGVHSIEAGYAGFMISAGQTYAPRDVTISNCTATDTGCNGLWDTFSGGITAGFQTLGQVPDTIRGLTFSNCSVKSSMMSFTSQLIVSTGNVAFTVLRDASTNNYRAGAAIKAVNADDASQWMLGTILSYTGTTLTIAVTSSAGAGTIANWAFATWRYAFRLNGVVGTNVRVINPLDHGYLTARFDTTPKNLIDFTTAGQVRLQGGTQIADSLTLDAAIALLWTARSQITSPSTNAIQLLNAAGTGGPTLNFGPADASHPALFPNGTILQAKLGDLSDDATVQAASVIVAGAGLLSYSAKSKQSSPTDGSVLYTNAAGSGFTELRFQTGASTYISKTLGSGSPEGVVTARVSSEYHDTTGGKLYIKETGTGNTGWVVK